MPALALWPFVWFAVFEHDGCGFGGPWSGHWLREIGATVATEACPGRILGAALRAAENKRATAPNAELLTRSILEVAV